MRGQSAETGGGHIRYVELGHDATRAEIHTCVKMNYKIARSRKNVTQLTSGWVAEPAQDIKLVGDGFYYW